MKIHYNIEWIWIEKDTYCKIEKNKQDEFHYELNNCN